MFINSAPTSRAAATPHPIKVFAIAAILVAASLTAASCGAVPPPKASYMQTAAFDRPPKPADCFIPVLYSEPSTNHRRIAIVEAWGAVGQEDQVLAALKSSGCQTGADALVIVEDKSQANPANAQFGLPETTEKEETRMDLTQGQRFKDEVTPAVGARGHPGYYLDSVAIVYDQIKADHNPTNH